MHERKSSNCPCVKFSAGNSELDAIALRIIWEKDKEAWENCTKIYPELIPIKNFSPKKVKEIMGGIYKAKEMSIATTRQNFGDWWSVVENKWFNFLQQVFETDDLKDVIFTAQIGISPTFPRDIEKESFLIPFFADKAGCLKITAHETSHFYFYRKLRKIRTEISEKEILTSRQFWIISELLVPLIFSDQRSIDILGPMPQTSYICRQSLIEKCRVSYQAMSEGRIDFRIFFDKLCRIKIGEGELNEKFFAD